MVLAPRTSYNGVSQSTVSGHHFLDHTLYSGMVGVQAENEEKDGGSVPHYDIKD